jgi:hypothetical protein
MVFAVALLGCSGSGPAAPQVHSSDNATTLAAIDALCKLVEGAGTDCTRTGTSARFNALELKVEGRLYPVETSLGTASLRGVVAIEGPGARYVTRLRGFGGGKAEALERGMHEWALVSGTAVVDTWMGPTRPTLAAVDDTPSGVVSPLPDTVLYRGWTLFRPKGELDHAGLLKAVAPVLKGVERPTTLSFEVTRQAGAAVVDCWVQGEPNDALCAAAGDWSWPTGEYELRTTYVVPPS